MFGYLILISIVKTLPDAAVSFEGGERVVSISCDKSTFRLNTLDPSDFPEFPHAGHRIEFRHATMHAEAYRPHPHAWRCGGA